MIVTNLQVSNFKSIDELSSSLQNYTVLIGPNAAGKSNIVGIFQFLSDVFTHGLDNAVSLQGGREYIRNFNIRSDKDLSVGVEIDSSKDDYFSMIRKRIIISKRMISKEMDERKVMHIRRANKYYAFKINRVKYNFTIYFLKTRKDIKIKSEYFYAEGKIYNMKRPYSYSRVTEEDYISSGSLSIIRRDNNISGEFLCDDEDIDLTYFDAMGDLENVLKFYKSIDRKTLFLQSEYMPGHITNIANFFKDMSIYNIEPRLSKTASKFSGRNELEVDGNNLVVVLKNIMEDKDLKYQLSLLLKKMLPFINDIGIERFSDRTLIASIKEKYNETKYVPASFMSDGTINVIAFLIILYFEKKNFVIIEEPERNMHPALISRLVSLIKEVSLEKQIIVTTHHPEIVRHAEINNLCLVKRNENGFTIMKHVVDLEDLSRFLEEDIGVNELFVDNILVNLK